MGKIRVADGTLMDPYNPRVEDVKLDVMAHSLSQINRFTGHAKFPYSVAQHTLNLAFSMKQVFKYRSTNLLDGMVKAALIHDLSEAWFNDLASPVKKENPDYKRAEHRAGQFIARTLGVNPIFLENLDKYDKAMYKNERNALFPVIWERGMGDDLEPLRETWLAPSAFYELSWRYVRYELWLQLIVEFPEHRHVVPFWERPEFNGGN